MTQTQEKQGTRQEKSDTSIDLNKISNINPIEGMNRKGDKPIMGTDNQETHLTTISSKTMVTDGMETRPMTISVIDIELRATMQLDAIDLIHAQ